MSHDESSAPPQPEPQRGRSSAAAAATHTSGTNKLVRGGFGVLLIGVVIFAAFQAGRQTADPGTPSDAKTSEDSVAPGASSTAEQSVGSPAPSTSTDNGPVTAAEIADASSTVPPPVPNDSPVPNAPPAAIAEPSEEPVISSRPKKVAFEPLLLDEPATSFAMTEDGLFLVVTHQTANQVSIYDILKGQVVQTVSVDSPRAVLCRGERVFVANFPLGSITVLSRGKNWERTQELQVDHSNVLYLSAPAGENFAEELLVTCHPDGSQGSYRGAKVFRVDVAEDKCRLINEHALATVSYDGKLVITQGSFNLSPSGGISAYTYEDFVGSDAKPVFQGGISQTPFIYQRHPGGYWLATNMVFGGVPLNQVQKDVGGILIPDDSQKVVYALSSETLTAFALNVQFQELDKRKVELPDVVRKDFSRINHLIHRHRSYLLDHPAAFTHGETLMLFVMDIKNGTILRASTPAMTAAPEADART